MQLLRSFKDLNKSDVGLAGGKGASLGEMTQAGIPVPPGFVILSASFEKFVQETELAAEIDAVLESVNHEDVHTVENASEKIQALILAAKMPKDIEKEIRASFKKLGAKFVAVRSSATAEDSASAAWAGQLDSYLNTTEQKILENVKRCWASLFTPRAIFYRFEQNLHKQKISVAVVVQKMVESEVSGVAFSVHPVTQDRNQLIIEASYGLGEAIVSGQVTPDSYIVEKRPRRIIERIVQTKLRGLYRSEKGENDWSDIAKKKAEAQALSDTQILKLSELILRVENHYGFPCDIEWALEKSEFYILQSRPITTLGDGSSRTAKDDAEAPGGYTLERVLERIKANVHWYNKSFSGYPFGIVQQGIGIARGEQDTAYAIPYGLLFQNHNKMDHFDWFWDAELMVEKRIQILDKVAEDGGFADEFYAVWKKKWDVFLARWETVAGIDFNAAASVATIREELIPLHEAVVEQTSYGYVVDTFLSNAEDDWLEKIIEHELGAVATPEVVAALTAPAYESFVNEFEFRKLKVAERIHRGENKKALLAECEAIEKDFFWIRVNYHSYARIIAEEIYKEAADEAEKLGANLSAKLREEKARIADHKKQKAALMKKLGASEKLRRVIGISEIFTHIQDKRKEGVLRANCLFYEALSAVAGELGIDHEPIFYITPTEFLDAKKFDAINWDEIRLRREKGVFFIFCAGECYILPRAEYEKQISTEHFFASASGAREVRGTVAYKGMVRGVARVVSNVAEIKAFKEGDILVANQTTPEYVPAMKKAAAFVTDQGGITCHAAIIAREMKKPCIIGTKNATQVIKSGDMVEVDAVNGVVRIIKRSRDVTEGGGKFAFTQKHWKKNWAGSWAALSSAYLSYQYTKQLEDVLGVSLKESITISHGGFSMCYFIDEYKKEFGVHFAKKAAKNPELLKEWAAEIKSRTDEVRSLMKELSQEDFSVDRFEFFLEKIYAYGAPHRIIKVTVDYLPREILNASLDVLEDARVYAEPVYEEMEKYYQHIARQIGRRHNVPPEFILAMTRAQFMTYLATNILPSADLLKKQHEGSVLYFSLGDEYAFSGEADTAAVEKMLLALSEDKKRELSGQTAYPGKAKGRVRVILDPRSVTDFKEGEILVTGMTRPEYLSLVKKSAGFITDAGGILSHAAITARELKKPCVIGTESATKMLKDGDMVEIDADNARIIVIE